MKDKQLEIISRQLGVITTILSFSIPPEHQTKEKMEGLRRQSDIIRKLIKEVENENN